MINTAVILLAIWWAITDWRAWAKKWNARVTALRDQRSLDEFAAWKKAMGMDRLW